MKKMLLLFVLSSFCRADELSDTLEQLEASSQKLKGYEASYQLTTEKGKTGTVDLGVDSQSGWGYLIFTLKDEKGEISQQGEQWITAEGLLVMKSRDQLVVFEGAEVLKRMNNLLRIFNANPTEIEARFAPRCSLTKERFEMTIGASSSGIALLEDAQKLLGKTEKEVTLALGPDYGVVTVDPKNSIITSQVIPVGQKKRTMTLIRFNENPGQEAISSRMTLKLDGAQKRPISEMGFGKNLLRKTLQQFLTEAQKSPKNIADLQTLIPSLEPGLIDFLSGESLERAGFVKEKFLISLIDKTMADAIPMLKADGKELTPKELIKIPGFRSQMIATFTQMLLPRVPQQKKQEYLAEALGGTLVSSAPSETEALTLIEELITRVYFKVRIGAVVDQYAKKLNKDE